MENTTISKTSNISNINFDKLIDNNNETVVKIFEYVKLRDWVNLIKLIKKTSIDLNIKDNSGTWLLEYAIIFNQSELIDILLEKNIRIDITDDNSKSILYNVIKFSYLDILEKILEKDKTSIGKSILELKDSNENIPLFYAIKLFNNECVKLILKNTNNFYISNSDGDNALHLAIKSQNFELFKLVWEHFNDIKSRNKQGESYLHIIIKLKCYDILEYFISKVKDDPNINQVLNFVEFRFNFSILHYICISIDYIPLEILLKYGILKLLDGEIQDNSGNIFFHYFISNILNNKNLSPELVKNITKMNELFKHIKWNINTYNIDGNTPSHIFFSNIDFFSLSNLNVLINLIGELTDMNIQNFIGESVFYMIIKNNYWKKISNLLVKKKLDIFIIVNGGETIFDHIEKKDYQEFLNMVTHSYLNQLSSDTKSSKWIEYWDNRCKKIVKLSELNETELELIKNLDIINDKIENKSKLNDNICFDIIKNKLDKAIEIFSQSKNVYDATSYPLTHKYVKLISKYPNVVISTFSGSTIDVLSGLIYLVKKFNNPINIDNANTKYIESSINIIKEKSDIIVCKKTKDINPHIKKSQLSQDIYNQICEIFGFEIMWINKNIIFPTNKNITINTVLNWIVKNKSDIFKWFIVPIGIELGSFAHANYLLIDIELMEVERFEPHGSSYPVGLNYEPELLDMFISSYLDESGLKFKYFKPKDYLPKIGFQTIEINELKSDYIGDPNGFCALWCIWWVDMRLSNPNIPRIKLVKQLNKELINSKISYKKLIRDYSQYIIDIRDKIFIKANTNINEWINDTIPEKNIELLNSVIIDEITNL
jgi:ankyrin repeat protein